MMTRGILLSVLAVAGVLAAAQTEAQSRYQSWQNPALEGAGTSGETAQDLVSKLRVLVDEAEKARAADPQFLRDLRALADSFDRPWTSQILDDSFADGNFTANPAWTVTSGRYWIESGYGLRSSVLAAAAQEPAKKASREELVIGVLGAMLGAQTQQGGQSQAAATPSAAPDGAAAIHVDTAISNAFSIRLEMASWKAGGRFEIGPGQSAYGNGGYRLAYDGGRWQLQRAGSRGTSVIDVTPSPVPIEDNKVHVVEWTRGRDGSMAVTLDGKPLLKAADRGYRESFDRLLVTNRSGDFTLRRVTVSGSN